MRTGARTAFPKKKALFTHAVATAVALVSGLLHGQEMTGTISGQVLDENGNPRRDIQVAAGWHLTKTDASGRFLLTKVRPGTYDVILVPPPEVDLVGDSFYGGPFKLGTRIAVEAEKVTRIVRRLAPGGRLEVTVRRSGVPVAAGEVLPPDLSMAGGGGFLPEPRFRAGTFVYWGLPARADYVVAFDPPGYAAQTVPGVSVAAGQITRLTLDFDPNHTTGVSGTIREQNGSPIKDALVYCIDTATSVQRGKAKTDAQGRFKIVGLTPGRYTLGAVGADDLAQVQVEAGAITQVEMTWPE